MRIPFVREFAAAVSVSRAVQNRRMPRNEDLNALGLTQDQFSYLRRR